MTKIVIYYSNVTNSIRIKENQLFDSKVCYYLLRSKKRRFNEYNMNITKLVITKKQQTMKKTISKSLCKTLFTSASALSSVTAPVVASAENYDALINEADVQIERLSAQQTALYAQLATAYAEIDTIQA